MVASNFSIPDNMKFGDAQVISIVTYSIMLLIGLSTNITSLFHFLRNRIIKKDRNRMSLLLFHLSIADLLVILSECDPLILGFCPLSAN